MYLKLLFVAKFCFTLCRWIDGWLFSLPTENVRGRLAQKWRVRLGDWLTPRLLIDGASLWIPVLLEQSRYGNIDKSSNDCLESCVYSVSDTHCRVTSMPMVKLLINQNEFEFKVPSRNTEYGQSYIRSEISGESVGQWGPLSIAREMGNQSVPLPLHKFNQSALSSPIRAWPNRC